MKCPTADCTAPLLAMIPMAACPIDFRARVPGVRRVAGAGSDLTYIRLNVLGSSLRVVIFPLIIPLTVA